MKLAMNIFWFTILLLTGASIVTGANAQDVTALERQPARPTGDNSIGGASALLRPPNTSSPRTTLKSFIENMNRAYGTLMKAHRQNLKTPGYFPSKAVRQMAKQAEEFFQSAVECLDLSQVPNFMSPIPAGCCRPNGANGCRPGPMKHTLFRPFGSGAP